MAVDAKILAEKVALDLGALRCPAPVLGTAMAIVVGHFAVQLDAAARERFYEMFILAASETEAEVTWLRADGNVG